MLKIFLPITVLISFLFAFQAAATPLRERVIRTGSHSGQKLIDVVEDYTIPGLAGGARVHIPSKAIRDAFNFFDRYAGTTREYKYTGVDPDLNRQGIQFLSGEKTTTGPTIGNQRYMAIFDLNLKSSLKRLHVINLETGDISSAEVAHSYTSDCGTRRPGYACYFISHVDSKSTPLGFFSTGQVYNNAEFGWNVTMNGLEMVSSGFAGNHIPSTIVIHKASYVYEGHAGRSHGCPAVSESNISWVRNNLKDGALFYFYHTSLDYSDRNPIVSGIQSTESASEVSDDGGNDAADDDEN